MQTSGYFLGGAMLAGVALAGGLTFFFVEGPARTAGPASMPNGVEPFERLISNASKNQFAGTSSSLEGTPHRRIRFHSGLRASRTLANFRAIRSRRERLAFLRDLFHPRTAKISASDLELLLRFHGADRNLALRALLGRLPGHAAPALQNKSLAERFAILWTQSNPELDLGFIARTLARLSPLENREPLLESALASGRRLTAASAEELLSALPAEVNPQRMIQLIGTRWASQNTSDALTWAAQLTADEQATARAAIQSVAPVGIGVALRDGGGSPYPLAYETIPGGPADRDGSIAKGTQIVAVLDAQNAWNGTAGKNLAAVVGLIRGSAGQSVQIRVLPPGVEDLSQARTITLVREQVLFKNAGG